MSITVKYILKRAGLLQDATRLPTFLSKFASRGIEAMERAEELNFEEIYKLGDVLSKHFGFPDGGESPINLIHRLTDYSDPTRTGPDPTDKEKISEELLYHLVRACFGRPFKRQAGSPISPAFQEHLEVLYGDIIRFPRVSNTEVTKDLVPVKEARGGVKKLFDAVQEYFSKVEASHPSLVSQVHIRPPPERQQGGPLSLRPDYGANTAARGPASGIPRAASVKHVKEWLKGLRSGT